MKSKDLSSTKESLEIMRRWKADYLSVASQEAIDTFRKEYREALAAMKGQNGRPCFTTDTVERETRYLRDEDIALYIACGTKSGKEHAEAMSNYL